MSTNAKPELASLEFWVPTSQEHALHVVEARLSGTPDSAPGILFVPGLFSDGRFFLGGQGDGFARTFVDAGCVSYVASLRGHGKSRWPAKRAYDWSFDTYVRHDIPDLVRAVRARHTGPLFILAHSMAGYAVLAALGVDPSLQASLSGVCTLSSAVNDYSDGGFKKRFQLGFSSTVAGMLGRFPAKALKQGPWDEPAGVMRQFTDWAPTGAFRSTDGATDYWSALGNVTLPVFAGVGAADVFHASPQRAQKLVAHLGSARKDLFVLGRAQGLSWDAGHFDVVRGERARAEVLPRVLAWMRQVAPSH
ncbi:alpha/beta fold hydrolase [Corallococcus sp. AB004]|uniref:alpha/beta fold hydrolase n=1 Tax=Corallococcus TaxID=83461 RepID=UPI000EA0A55D|nr:MULTISPECIES: alpha/beta fold hydrolase [Corallococcus]NPD24565.1 alpha/beta fold hydrolase [Corallococcus exiguus]NRD45004.1 alpha/beta hydrolase [Corallococcus exiguus]RKH93851.1 alpha/beta fold hydrolase [Corallococcus sp. AB038B]RKI45422.1 alpha/beta fold hydrolase [Corallococcus sp. AB004]